MHQPGPVGRAQPSQALLQDGQRLVHAQAAPGESAVQRLALHVPHGEEVAAGVLADEVNRHDVGVRHAGHGGGLGAEAADEVLLAHQFGRQHLDGHLALEDVLIAEVDVAHAALADAPEDAVVAQPLKRQTVLRAGGRAGLTGERGQHTVVALGGRIRQERRCAAGVEGSQRQGRLASGGNIQGDGEGVAVGEALRGAITEGLLDDRL